MLLLLVTVAGAVLLWQRLSDQAALPAARARAEPLPPPVPRIDLARLSVERPDGGAGRRDLFQFGSAHRGSDPDEVEAAVPVYSPPTPPPLATTASAQPSQPPLKLKYLGSVESRAGVKVAVLVTDRQEVLTGQAGETVANRYRIARIGLESVDLEDIASGQAQRLPLKGN